MIAISLLLSGGSASSVSAALIDAPARARVLFGEVPAREVP